MPKMNVNKGIFINAKPQEVYNKLNDFHHWTKWSPWLIIDDKAKVDVDADGKYYEWDGKLVGAGNMKVLEENENSIEYDLNFLKPWKSHAHIGFKLTPKEEGTQVNWTMNSSIPFFMFWMKKSMTAFVGMDYERGLRMLKDYVEHGEVYSVLNVKGEEPLESMNYIGIKRTCTIDEMGKDMQDQFSKIGDFLKENNSTTNGRGFSIYHKWDMVSRKAEYTAAMTVDELPTNLSPGMVAGVTPQTTVHTIEHKGKYEHLGNAWNAQYSRQRSKAFKMSKKMDPIEVYINDPTKTDEKELLTAIHFPTKAM